MQEASFMVPEPYHWTPESQLKYMDKANIQTQMLSYIPQDLDALRSANDYVAQLREKHPTRFGMLAALPTDDVEEALREMKRVGEKYKPDGWAVTTCYKGTWLADKKLDPLWSYLNESTNFPKVMFVHPDAYAPGPTFTEVPQPTPLLEVAFETTRGVINQLYSGHYTRYPNLKWIIAHCGGAVPCMSGRLVALGTEAWVPNPLSLTKDQIRTQLSNLYVDTAATGRAETMDPALKMLKENHIVYGSDSGVPCSTEETLEENRLSLIEYGKESGVDVEGIGRRALELFPELRKRLEVVEGEEAEAR